MNPKAWLDCDSLPEHGGLQSECETRSFEDLHFEMVRETDSLGEVLDKLLGMPRGVAAGKVVRHPPLGPSLSKNSSMAKDL